MSALPEFEAANDPDALETQEWVDALEAVLEREGPERAHFLLERLIGNDPDAQSQPNSLSSGVISTGGAVRMPVLMSTVPKVRATTTHP